MPIAPHQTPLFLGDSITHAHRRPEEIHDGYRLGSGYSNSVAGELSSAEPDAGYQYVNHGECGYTVRDLLQRWERDLVAVDAAVVSILIGINDAHASDHQPSTFRENYQRLLLAIRKRLPAAHLMLLEPFGQAVPTRKDVEVISAQQLDRLAVIQQIVKELAIANDTIFVPTQHLFQSGPATAWMLDGIHPSAAGHWRIARAWTTAARRAGWFPPVTRQGEIV